MATRGLGSIFSIGQDKKEALIGGAVVVIGEPFLNRIIAPITSKLPTLGGIQSDDIAKLFIGSYLSHKKGIVGQAGHVLTIIAAVRMMDSLTKGFAIQVGNIAQSHALTQGQLRDPIIRAFR